VQPILDLVFVERVVFTGMWLWPKVLRVRAGSAYFQRDQVVFLVIARVGVGVSVCNQLLALEGVRKRRRRPKLFCASPVADVVGVRANQSAYAAVVCGG
jgi:hypothetical protein